MRREAAAMLRAAVLDLRRGYSGSILIPLCAAVAFPCDDPGCSPFPLNDGDDLAAQLQPCCADADCVLIVAPESGGQLARLVQSAEETIGPATILLNLNSHFTRLFSDKLATYRWLQTHGFCSPVSLGVTDDFARNCQTAKMIRVSPVPSEAVVSPSKTGQWVLKPRDGVGSDRVSVVADDVVRQLLLSHPPADPDLDPADVPIEEFPWLIQHRSTGESCSVALIGRGPHQSPLSLPAAIQRIDSEGTQLRYAGGAMPADKGLQGILQSLSRKFAKALRPCFGYVGIDVIVDRETGTAAIVDVNPRLCTSFVGYRSLTRHVNDRSLLRGRITAADLSPERLCFDLSGNVTVEDTGATHAR